MQYDVPLTSFQLLRRLNDATRLAYSKFLSAQPGDSEKDEEISKVLDEILIVTSQLEFSFVKKLLSDASIDRDSHEKLKEIEEILNEIVNDKKTTVRDEHYLYKKFKCARNQVRNIRNNTKVKGKIEYVKIQKEKRKLSMKEKDAREKMGKKAA